MSRFARIAPASTSSSSRHVRSHAAAEPVERSSSVNGRHSACQLPAARSCSCAIAPRSVATSPGACAAHAAALTAATGLRLWGIVEEPPAAPSATSATSVWAMSVTSRAAFATTPQAVPSAPASSAGRVRIVCHGSTGWASPRSRAMASMTSTPRSPSEARVPAAPPSCTARRSSRTVRRRAIASSRPVSQPAAFSPSVTGTACWSSVRPARSVPRCSAASRADAAAAAARSSSSGARARWATSIAAVSTMSWLVAPLCTWPAAAPSTRSRERLHERCGRVAGRRGLLAELRGVVVRRAARGGDGLRVRRRDEPRLGRGAGERRLRVEHRLQPRGVADGLPHASACEDAVEQPRLSHPGTTRRRRPSHPGPGCAGRCGSRPRPRAGRAASPAGRRARPPAPGRSRSRPPRRRSRSAS